ncbi:22642_t:CDS:1 [Cetraspora pellucida]|uniref:22642_t:CDS:1 n=1 Tax=Cetraspora pellucida TaxID=1433469 RepID=A0A9N9E2J3_9GLOM|nr:22642_t:CDS:1 [Cetraspora pellucida]
MKCNFCKKPTSYCCSRCKIKYYCSKSCQKKDYANHVLVCPQRSADILVKSVFRDLIPTKNAVLYEYGFYNCVICQDRIMLFGLYADFIKLIDCSASQLHSWWENGELLINIKKVYDDGGYTSGYYKWFLKNEHLLQGLRKYEGIKSDNQIADNLSNKFHSLIKPYLSKHDQTILFKSLPEPKNYICTFYLTILTGYLPRIEQKLWIDFGFCSCRIHGKYNYDNSYKEGIYEHVRPIAGNNDLSEEARLKNLYWELIVQKGCMVDEFTDAYVSGTVLDLLKKKCDNTSWLSASKIETIGYNQPNKSVYNLEQYILSEAVGLIPSVRVDYGFFNCRTKDEEKQLKNMYKKLFLTPQFDAHSLHKACITGKLFKYISSILPNDVLRADLLRNPYPLKEID